MKRFSCALVLGSLLIGFQSFAADSAFEMDLESNPAVFFHSKRYDQLIQNDDSRVTLINPKFGSPDGEVKLISESSDLTGLCKLFGFPSAVPSGKLSAYPNESYVRAVQINANSNFEKYVNVGSSSGNHITHLMCNTTMAKVVSTRYEKIMRNDDDSITIINPRFGSPDGGVKLISESSDLNGLCKLFGYLSAVPSGKLSAYPNESYVRAVQINANSNFEKYVNVGSSSGNHITHLMCNK